MFLFETSLFTSIIFFRENKLFQRDWGSLSYAVEIPEEWGWGVISSLQISKIQGGGGGGGLSKIPSMVGYGYFLEPHIIAVTFSTFF